MNLTPRHKLIAAAVALCSLPLFASLQGASTSSIARVLLGLAAVAGIAFWFIKARGAGLSKFKAAPRLQVVQRVGLSQRTGVALVEVDGRPWLIVHGDGFARMRAVSRPRRVQLQPSQSSQPAAEAAPAPSLS